jgi:PhzF family phenazine biosynthesis protein
MRTYQCYQVDSFTREKFSGNPAGVVLDATGLQDTEMQKIAREFNNSETAFLFPTQEQTHDVAIRFFTPLQEVPICGHATIAAHYVRARELGLGRQCIRQKTKAGILPVDILPEGDDYHIQMTQGAIEFGSILSGQTMAQLLCALGIQPEDLISPSALPIQIVSTGHSKVMVGIRSRKLLDTLQPGLEALAQISRQIGCNGFYVFTLHPDSDILVHGRMFAPAIGIAEDPVTGNANGPLGAYLVRYEYAPAEDARFRFTARQGEAIGRAGTVKVEVSVKDRIPQKVCISGNAVIVFHTELHLDDK